MIRDHEFNTRWWGSPAGFVHDPEFFSLGSAEQKELLRPYGWAEFYSELEKAPALQELEYAGFFQADTQIQFLLNLFKINATPSTERLEVCFADQQAFEVRLEELADFEHERFRHLPDCTSGRINRRYALWANDLIRESPGNCLQVLLDGRVQGWFLSRPGSGRHLNLTLAMLSNHAEISGMLLYQKACLAYAERGHRLGEAGFSATNTAVHNIYAALGARFMPPGGCWMWLAGGALPND